MADPDAAAPPAGDVILRAEGVTKSFGGTTALDSVNMVIRAGEVHVLMGENGAGKSTLVKIIVGALEPDAGRLVLDGAPVSFPSPREALDAGIGVIHQEFSLFPNLSVTDNLFAGRELASRGVVDRGTEDGHARRLLERLEVHIDPRELVGHLRVAEQQIVEIARALSRDVRVLVMDEPTSALGITETKVLLRLIRELRSQGVAIVYISHKMDEIFEVGDAVTILRDGRLVASTQIKDVSPGWMVEQMVGRPLGSLFASRSGTKGEELLKVTSLRVADPLNPARLVVEDVTFSVHAGEIVGIYGLRGAGQSELVDCLIGRLPAEGGQAVLAGEDLLKLPLHRRLGIGLGLVPEDRQRDGLVPKMSIAHNLTLSSLRAQMRGFWVAGDIERRRVADVYGKLDVRGGTPNNPVSSLSGGNQQKVVVGRALLGSPKVLLLHDPTRGVDVGAKAELFRTMSDLAAEGFGIVLISTELDELLAMTDRIIVMTRGHITAEFDQRSADEADLVMAASGDAAAREATVAVS